MSAVNLGRLQVHTARMTTFKPAPGSTREGRAHAGACVSVSGIARAGLPSSTLRNWKVTPLSSSLAVMIIEASGNAFPLPLQAHNISFGVTTRLAGSMPCKLWTGQAVDVLTCKLIQDHSNKVPAAWVALGPCSTYQHGMAAVGTSRPSAGLVLLKPQRVVGLQPG